MLFSHSENATIAGCRTASVSHPATGWSNPSDVEEQVMRAGGVARSPTLAAVTVSASMAVAIATGLPTAAPASASDGDFAINGTYIATSNGDWAQTREQYHNEATVISKWTIATTCTTTEDCTGTVTSDQGWTAPIWTHAAGSWYVDRDLPTWEPCPDGSFGHGKQRYRFYPAGPGGAGDLFATNYVGADKTIGDSGACGVNKSLVIEMPFSLVRTG
jgi:hypothetical protein